MNTPDEASREAEIEARLEAATPGPWEPVLWNEGLWNECMGIRGPNPYGDNRIEALAQLQWFSHSAEDEDKATESSYANMRLMGHAVQDLRYLLDQLRAARERIEHLEHYDSWKELKAAEVRYDKLEKEKSEAVKALEDGGYPIEQMRQYVSAKNLSDDHRERYLLSAIQRWHSEALTLLRGSGEKEKI